MNKKLFRSIDDRIVAGVCGGVAEYLDIDSTLVRLIFVILTVWGGAGLIVYIVLWILTPLKSNSKTEQKEATEKASSEIKASCKNFRNSLDKKNSAEFVGLIILLLGVLFLLKNLFSWFDFDYFWPILLIVVGILLIATSGSERRNQ